MHIFFLIYMLKTALCLSVFYLFYRLWLRRKQREGERFFAKLDLFDVNENKYTTQPCEITLCFYGDTRIL